MNKRLKFEGIVAIVFGCICLVAHSPTDTKPVDISKIGIHEVIEDLRKSKPLPPGMIIALGIIMLSLSRIRNSRD